MQNEVPYATHLNRLFSSKQTQEHACNKHALMVKCVDPALIVAPDRFAKVAKRKKSENFGLTKPFMDLKYEGFFFFTVDLVV